MNKNMGEKKHNYSTQEIYKKTKKWRKINNFFRGCVFASAIGIIGTFGYEIGKIHSVFKSKTPEIVKIYQNAEKTLDNLKQEKKLREKSNFPYYKYNKEVNDIVYKFKKEESRLENTINSVDRDMSEIRLKNLEFKEYQKNEEKNSKLLGYLSRGLPIGWNLE